MLMWLFLLLLEGLELSVEFVLCVQQVEYVQYSPQEQPLQQ